MPAMLGGGGGGRLLARPGKGLPAMLLVVEVTAWMVGERVSRERLPSDSVISELGDIETASLGEETLRMFMRIFVNDFGLQRMTSCQNLKIIQSIILKYIQGDKHFIKIKYVQISFKDII